MRLRAGPQHTLQQEIFLNALQARLRISHMKQVLTLKGSQWKHFGPAVGYPAALIQPERGADRHGVRRRSLLLKTRYDTAQGVSTSLQRRWDRYGRVSCQRGAPAHP